MYNFENKRVIEMHDWTGSFDKIATKGDLITEEIYNEMVNCLPPKVFRSGCTQMGEAYDHRIDPDTFKVKETYLTFKTFSKGLYEFCGACFLNENEERGKKLQYA